MTIVYFGWIKYALVGRVLVHSWHVFLLAYASYISKVFSFMFVHWTQQWCLTKELRHYRIRNMLVCLWVCLCTLITLHIHTQSFWPKSVSTSRCFFHCCHFSTKYQNIRFGIDRIQRKKWRCERKIRFKRTNKQKQKQNKKTFHNFSVKLIMRVRFHWSNMYSE